MCGVIGYVGTKPCVDFLFQSLKKLEYRGYDSTGIATLTPKEGLRVIKSEGKLDKLQPHLNSLPSHATMGLGHTRWATHGVPSQKNSHPHAYQGTAIIHNGILENYKDLKAELVGKGSSFISDTDSEVFVHILLDELKTTPDMRQALIKLLPQFRGAYALGVLSDHDPEAFYLIKQGSPVVIGLGENENFFASDAVALGERTSRFIFLEDGEFARISKDKVSIWNFDGKEIHREAVRLEWSPTQVEKHGHRHYMLKEIYEQPAVIANIIERFYDPVRKQVSIDKLNIANLDLARIDRVQILGCGTAYYAGLMGKYLLEPALKLPVSVELASELRYRDPYLDSKTLVIAMTQSGETADTLACVKLAKKMGAQVLSICNVRFSSIARESTAVLYMEAGPEIGVASTKAFTAMVLDLYFFAIAAARLRGSYDSAQEQKALAHVLTLPTLADQTLSREKQIAAVARKYFEVSSCLFVGRGFSFPLALEGALKLKEISYIHAEGYAGGELKHGPIALIDRNMVVISVVPMDRHREKMLSNIEEIRARDGKIVGIGCVDDHHFQSLSDDFIPCAQIDDEGLQALLSIIPMQLFAYTVAVLRGTDVDQPRNLAKSVTVE